MAPVKISYVVSFSSQDPKYPAENLLSEGSVRPWLGCPQDRSRRLSVELQLERASPIGYVDIGMSPSPCRRRGWNCGCAFLQIEVGRSSWPRDQPYVTLVPTVTLMTPGDSKLGQNRCGVRMFKEADFPVPAVGQHWDRLRLTCSQPFSPRSRFGLSFIRLRTPQEREPQPPRPPLGLVGASHSSGAEEQLRSRLWQLEGGAGSPAYLSRSARMVLSAVRSRALRPGGDPELPAKDLGGPVVPVGEPVQLCPGLHPHHCGQQGARWRFCPSALLCSASSRQPPALGPPTSEGHGVAGMSPEGATEPLTTTSPLLSTGCFLVDALPTHASHCGEEDRTAAWPSLSPDTWVSCPICELPFSMAEVEQHASTCGETLSSP
ncbi:XRCC1 protein, partial [Tyrannus savana]|nr:XRCC1 protein [Tyrannus savana]